MNICRAVCCSIRGARGGGQKKGQQGNEGEQAARHGHPVAGLPRCYGGHSTG
jgi:hypothetical protein